jgi:hypothetical protein
LSPIGEDIRIHKERGEERKLGERRGEERNLPSKG